MKIVNEKIPADFKDDINRAVVILKEAGRNEIYVFGSIARGETKQSSDIDIAVKGLPKRLFFKISGKMLFELKHKFDLIELDDDKNNFSKFILENEVFVRVA